MLVKLHFKVAGFLLPFYFFFYPVTVEVRFDFRLYIGTVTTKYQRQTILVILFLILLRLESGLILGYTLEL